MERKYALLIFVGLGFGAIYGMFFFPVVANDLLGIALGAFGGAFLGWFVAIALQRRDTANKPDQ